MPFYVHDVTIHSDTNHIRVTNKKKRFLVPIFAILGFIFSVITFLGYYNLLYDVNPINIYGISVAFTLFSNFIEIFLSLTGGFILGTLYFCCWEEGWEINTVSPNIASFEFFKGFGFIKKTKIYSKSEINEIFVEKIPYDELGMIFLYKLEFLAISKENQQPVEKTLLMDLDHHQIHAVGTQILALLQVKSKLVYKKV